jgi:EAL domain-containing protein (putative c-di-GMP-specific phosphodiesterase class I)/FixJ family two-component response regulator
MDKGSMHLLVIDDDVRICSFVAAIGTALGWTVDTAGEKARFEALMHERRPDAVIVDLQLGATDGIEVLRFLADARYRGPVVLVSGFDDRVLSAAQDVGASFGLDIVQILEKPIRAAIMRGLLTELESRHSAQLPSQAQVQPGVAATVQPGFTSQDIARALDAGEMLLHFQPIVSAGSLDVVSLEALIRWQHPIIGLVQPDQFIPIAEQDDETIDKLTMWVIQKTLQLRRCFEQAGISVPIAVNISGINLHRLEFPDLVARQLVDAGFAPTALTFEMTESIATIDAHRATDILTRLRLKGFELAIDDLGTGYSSLRALRNIPFSCLKIDKSFVLEAATSRASLAIVKSIIDMGRSMRLRSVAEGVETAEIASQMTELGIDAMQGFHFTQPLPADKLIGWIADRRKMA